MSCRRDTLGRRIGYNWWREYNMAIFHETETARAGLRESGMSVRASVRGGRGTDTCYYQLSDAEFDTLHPRVTLKELLIANKGVLHYE